MAGTPFDNAKTSDSTVGHVADIALGPLRSMIRSFTDGDYKGAAQAMGNLGPSEAVVAAMFDGQKPPELTGT